MRGSSNPFGLLPAGHECTEASPAQEEDRMRIDPRVLSSVLLVVTTACEHEGDERRGPSSQAPTISVDGAELNVGFESGHIRERVPVASFAISKFPVTRAEYA